MEGATCREVTEIDVEQYNDDESSEDKSSHSDLTSVTQPTETASGHSGHLSSKIKASDSGLEDEGKKEDELLECEMATNRKEKRKQEKKKPDSDSPEVENTADQVCVVEEKDQNGGSSVSTPNAEEGCEKNGEELEPSTPRKKKKKKKKKKTQAVTNSELPTGGHCHVTGSNVNSNNVDLLEAGMSNGKVETGQHSCQIRSNLEDVAHETDVTLEDEKDLDEMKNKMLGVEDEKSSNKEGGDSVISGFSDGSHKAFECTPDYGSTLLTAGEDFPASDEKVRCSSPEVVPESMDPEATVKGGAEETEGGADPMGELKLSDAEDACVKLDHEGRNILCIFKLVYGVGLRALRNLFMVINPTWSNQPSDAAVFDRGRMKLNKEEEVNFNNGNISEWDFSLITTVLRYSKQCALEIAKRPGNDTALEELKKLRNRLLGHPSTDQMSDEDFDIFWPVLSAHFVTLGADATEIAEIKLQSDEDLLAGSYYKTLFVAEKEKLSYVEKKVDSIDSKVDTLIDMANQIIDGPSKTPISPKDLSGPKWDEWIKFCDAVGDFDTRKNQYILVADSLTQDNLDCFSILRSVPWKIVLDFDPMSEEKGVYREFTSHEGQGNLVSMVTPAELKRLTMVNLARQIDPCKTQWLFVNGRSSDTEGKPQEFSDWEATSVKEISRFFGCCCDPDKFDKQKPVVCLILPYCQKSVPYFEVTLSRLFENFDDQFSLKVVSFQGREKQLSVFRKVKIQSVDLEPNLVHLGLKQMFCLSSTQRYRMPTSQANVYYDLSEKEYLFLKEHLDILYEGCEELPVPGDNSAEDDLQLQNFLEEHRKLFVSGNQISFASLYDNHDAKREIGNEIRIHVQRLLDKRLTRSMIVEIKHSPGTGGTTIARRVMWDLHKNYPCAFIEIRPHLYFDEDNSYANKLADCIAALEEMCHTPPVILIDGKQSKAIESLSNKLVRMLGKKGRRALLLRCQHGSKTSSKEIQEPVHVHKVFYEDVKLEDSCADLNEFKKKYNEFIEKSLGETRASGPCRVFHFPLLAMVQIFRPKLKKIIDDTWDEMEGLQQEIAVLVAFLQLYANQQTPALLLYDAFRRYVHVEDTKTVTYENIKQLFTEHLLNLMVPSNPFRRRGRVYQFEESSPESYTLQHRLVAEMLLKKAFEDEGYDLFRVVNQFLQFPIYQREEFMPLFEELFVYNKDGQKKRKFSLLFEELKAIKPERAAEVFCEAAEKTGDSVIFSNAARFYAKMEPPSFRKAMELMELAFKSSNAKQRLRSLCHTKGVVLYIELQHMVNTGRVKDLDKLEELASKVLELYKEARNFPPTYPNPLIGEVEVWLACIGWIMKNKCERDSEKTLKFLANQCPPFFRTCVSDSFCLLDVVDGIVQSVPSLSDPEDTQRRCNNARLALMKNFRTRLPSSGRGRDAEDVVQACKALCNAKNFPRSSALELKRLQALFILNSSDSIDTLKQEHLRFLQTLLGELVFKERECRLAYHLMKVCVLVTGPQCYSLEQGLAVTEKWLEVSHHDCLPYFYQMAICFLKILDGHALEFVPKYLKAWKLCREKSQNHCRSTHSSLFVSKDGIGMSRLITRNTVFRGETDYSTDVQSDTVPRFWLVDIRKKLLECKGRIRVGSSSGHGKTLPYIELIQGNVELYVAKNAGIGKVHRDFDEGQLAYFVVSFNLQGPVANGITFEPQNPSSH